MHIFIAYPLVPLPILRVIAKQPALTHSVISQKGAHYIYMPSMVGTSQGVNDWGRSPPWVSLYML